MKKTEKINRYLEKEIKENLDKKMAFIGGPRQVHLGSKDFGHPSTGRVLPFLQFSKELSSRYGF